MTNSEIQGFLDGIVEQYNELQEKGVAPRSIDCGAFFKSEALM